MCNANSRSLFIIQEREAQEQTSAVREAEIAAANPLLNLQAALGQGAAEPSGGSFAVKKRWDDGMSVTLTSFLCSNGWTRPDFQEPSGKQ